VRFQELMMNITLTTRGPKTLSKQVVGNSSVNTHNLFMTVIYQKILSKDDVSNNER